MAGIALSAFTGNREWAGRRREGESDLQTLIQAVDKIKEGYDYLLAVGGGNVIDGVKFVTAGAVFDGDPVDMFGNGVTRTCHNAKSLAFRDSDIAIYGIKMNNNSVVTFVEKQRRSVSPVHMYPQIAPFWNRKQTHTHCRKRQLANGVH